MTKPHEDECTCDEAISIPRLHQTRSISRSMRSLLTTASEIYRFSKGYCSARMQGANPRQSFGGGPGFAAARLSEIAAPVRHHQTSRLWSRNRFAEQDPSHGYRDYRVRYSTVQRERRMIAAGTTNRSHMRRRSRNSMNQRSGGGRT